ncbi:hypothetical protein [Methanobacterium sp. SMA-27]|uniref:hypothetical protein n=1 Tax=Methanobacterium sp. SMA-27 TaxID=1495336 RepID=UPI000AEA2C7B|nr:hypothetical protein [Methanobacterium sp. SMA-27]
MVIFAVALFTFGKSVDGYVPAQNPAEIAAVSIGETVLSGQQVVDSTKIRKVPVIYHPEYLIEDLKSNQFTDFFTAITTGSVETPIVKITGGNVSRYGDASGFNGPGMVSVNGSKLVVNPPETFVWGYKTPYTVAVKTDKGIDIKTENKTVKTVAAADISNDTVPTMYVNVTDLKEWYNSSDVGDSIGLDFSLSKFNDGRNSVSPSKISSYFGNDTVKYMSEYPSGAPVMVYNGGTNQNIVGSGADTVGYYAEYDNVARAENSRTFVKAWNNTIVPPHSSASGKEDVTFTGVYDPELHSWVSHGACPAGRALRSAVMDAGSPLPKGMGSGFYCVDLVSNPATGIFVNNPTDYPIKIVMWTSGSGTGMGLFAKTIQYTP